MKMNDTQPLGKLDKFTSLSAAVNFPIVRGGPKKIGVKFDSQPQWRCGLLSNYFGNLFNFLSLLSYYLLT